MARFHSISNRYLGGILRSDPPHAPAEVTPERSEFEGSNPTAAFQKPKAQRSETGDPEMDRLLNLIRSTAPLPNDLTAAQLTAPLCCDDQATTPLHVAAARGTLSKIHSKLLTLGLMLTEDANGRTPLHRAVSRRTFDKVPATWINRDTLLAKDNQNRTVIDLALDKGIIDLIPEEFRNLSNRYRSQFLESEIREERFDSPEFRNFSVLSTPPPFDSSSNSWFHWFAREGLLASLPDDCPVDRSLNLHDDNGRTPLHVGVAAHSLNYLPQHWITTAHLMNKDAEGNSAFHLLAAFENLGDIPQEIITKEALLSRNNDGISVADVIEDYGNTDFLPVRLRCLSKTKALEHLDNLFLTTFPTSEVSWNRELSEIITRQQFEQARNEFVREWSKAHSKHALDEQQAEAVAEQNTHLQVVARAGSGKTRTLVTRILFQVKHCRIAPYSILALAFNKAAAKEIRVRLSKHLSPGEMPHVMTFHALAWRIVQPNSEILFDPEGHDSKKKLSLTIDKIIKKRFQNANTTKTLQRIMGIRWEKSLDSIVRNCLKADEIANEIHQRELVEDRALDYHRVDNVIEKWVYNFLLWYDVKFKYKENLHYHGIDVHQATFLIPRDGQKNLVIELPAPAQQNAATTAFRRSSKANSYEILQLSLTNESDRKDIHRQLKKKLNEADIFHQKLSIQDLWERIKKVQIDEFTKSVQGFIARCQKELLWPDDLKNAIQSYDAAEEIQELFWKESLDIYRDYEDELTRTNQTDFDRLMMDAASHMDRGNTKFKTSNLRIPGDVKQIKHLLIDEFQDFSHLFNRLRKSILKITPDIQFFCVGDDWQAINRFTGSNVCYFHDYPKNFPNVTTIGLQTNYRSCTRIVDEGNRVMKGLGLPSLAHKEQAGRICQVQIGDLPNLTAEEEILSEASSLLACHIMRIAQSDGMPLAYLRDSQTSNDPKRKLVVLSRYTKIEGSTLEQWQNTLRSHLPDEAKQQIEISTSHGYKGQEADTVIILHPDKYPLVHLDSIFSTIFGENLSDLVMDERRLFYVAVTRAESKLIFLREKDGNLCEFIPAIDRLEALNLKDSQPFLLSGDKALIEVKNLASISDSNRFGTIPLKDEIKADFKWNGDKKAWVKSVASEQVQISNSVIALLSGFPWHSKIEQVEIRVSTNKLTYRYELNKGHFKRLDASLTSEQQEEIVSLKDTIGEALAEAVEAILLDLKQDWPEIGHECENGDVMEVAWLKDKIGLYLPDRDIEHLKKQGWRLFKITSKLSKTWKKSLLPCFHSRASPRVMNEGIHSLYHFTDASNQRSIDQFGILSLKQLMNKEVTFTPSGNELSHQLDQDKQLDDDVHLCLTPHHPMAYQAKDRGSISDPIFLKISPTVLDLPGVRACMNVSVAAGAKIIPLETALSTINWADWTTYWHDDSITGREDFAENPIFKIEILIPKQIMRSFIQNATTPSGNL